MTRVSLFRILAGVWFITFSCFAGIINVPEDVPTIRQGIERAANGDTVLVAPGTYVENLDFRGKAITVASYFLLDANEEHIANTIIDGGGRGSVVTFANKETVTSRLNGFTIRNGSGTLRAYVHKPFYYGGGVFCEGTAPALENLIIRQCNASGGGGIFLKSADAIMENIMLKENIAQSYIWESPNVGGGILIWDSNPVIRSSHISNNYSELAGGGIYCMKSAATIYNTAISGNRSGKWGGGVFCESFCQSRFSNVTIVNNIAETGGGVFCMFSTHPVLFNSIVWYNEPQQLGFHDILNESTLTIDHCNIQDGQSNILNADLNLVYWLRKNTSVEPAFIDQQGSNYRLQPVSPCRDAGTIHIIFESDTLFSGFRDIFFGRRPDVGAFEFIPGEDTLPDFPNQEIEQMTVYPNPFNPVTTIHFNLPEAGHIGLAVYDILGRKVASLLDERRSSGTHAVSWQAANLASGVYLLVLHNQQRRFVRRIILSR